MKKKTSLLLFFFVFLILTTNGEEPTSGEEPPDTPDNDFIVILGENATYLNNNQTIYEAEEELKFNILETYLPLFIFVLDLPLEDRKQLREYMRDKTYEKLKFDIDSRVKMHKEHNILGQLNETLVKSIDSLDRFDDVTVDVVQGYHNASVYNAIRSIWLKQLRPFLPLIDQMAIMQYFSQRKASEYERMSIWARIWENLSVWMYGKKQPNECYAIEPKCVRTALESLNFEQRVDLDVAAYENKFDNVDGIIRMKLEENQKTKELDEWIQTNRLPKPLDDILKERSDVEEEALQRLRDNGVLSSLNHYYKAVIETKTVEEQEEIRRFFEVMNDTFARCFDPLRGAYHDF